MPASKKSPKRPNKIFCGLPLYGPVPPEFIKHWILFSMHLGRHHARVMVVSMPYVDCAQNFLVDNALLCKCGHVYTSHRLRDDDVCRGFVEKDGAPQPCPCQRIDYVEDFDYLVLTEHDNIVPGEWLDRVETYKVPISSLLYFGKTADDQRPIPGTIRDGRSAKPKGAFDRLSEDQLKAMGVGPDADPKKRGLHPVDVVGMGATAIRRDILVNWDRKLLPWFQVKHVPPSGFMGQDVRFCMAAKKQGWQAYVDTTSMESGRPFHAKHLGTWSSDEETFAGSMAWQRQRAKEAA